MLLHLAEIFLLVAPGDEGGSTDDGTTAGTEGFGVVDTPFADVTSADHVAFVIQGLVVTVRATSTADVDRSVPEVLAVAVTAQMALK